MKLKYKFVVREIDGTYVAVAVGKDNAKFNGMLKLNESGAFIFELLFDDVDEDFLIQKLMETYDISEENAKQTVLNFVEQFRQNNLLEE